MVGRLAKPSWGSVLLHRDRHNYLISVQHQNLQDQINFNGICGFWWWPRCTLQVFSHMAHVQLGHYLCQCVGKIPCIICHFELLFPLALWYLCTLWSIYYGSSRRIKKFIWGKKSTIPETGFGGRAPRSSVFKKIWSLYFLCSRKFETNILGVDSVKIYLCVKF